MSSGKAPANFPDAEAKLAKPIKQSAFERSKAEAEAKRRRDEAETAAVYEEFVKSFERDDELQGAPKGPSRHRPPRHGFAGPPSGPLHTGKRHFAMSGMKSGPGTLGPAPTSFSSRRTLDEMDRGSRDGHHDQPLTSATTVSEALNDASDDDTGGDGAVKREAIERAEMKAIAKPQLRLSNLPPGTSPAAIRALIPETLVVDAVKIEPPTGSGNSEKRCTSAVVSLSRESPGSELDAAVSGLQNRYLGYGHYLSVSRHLSSAVFGSATLPPPSSSAGQPFGAKVIESAPTKQGGQQAFRGRGYAPPTSYGPLSGSSSGLSGSSQFYVPVTPPEDIRLVRLVHMIVERVLEYGPEFEALLMSRPEVQREERWAWLWDPKSVGGLWYRWRLWQMATGYEADPKREPYARLFDEGPAWKVPDRLPFEFVTELDDFVSDPDYDSSDEEEAEAEANRERGPGELERPYLNPLEKAKLVHLLARLPTSLSKLRKGDIARVTAFAITHADRGPSEVVDLILSNIETPFSLSGAHHGDKWPDGREGGEDGGTVEGGPDVSAARLIGLYVMSDMLSSSSTTVVRHAWRFRGLVEKALRERDVFGCLGMMPEKLGWGRLRAEKWKRSIGLVLNLWEGWCLFPAKTQEHFVRTFESPPVAKAEEDRTDEGARKGKWRVVDSKPASGREAVPGSGSGAEAGAGTGARVAAEAAEAEAGGKRDEDEQDDVMGEPIDDEDVEGEPIDEDDVEGEPVAQEEEEKEEEEEEERLRGGLSKDDANVGPGREEAQGEGTGRRRGSTGDEGDRPRKRMRAVDMFAETEESEAGSGS